MLHISQLCPPSPTASGAGRPGPCHPPRETMRARAAHRAASAFSLVELVIALAVLAVGLVGAMRVFPVGLRASQRSEMVSRAALAAQHTIESLRLQPWESLEPGEDIVETQGPFTLTARVAQPALEHLADATRLKSLDVTVEWTQDGRPRSVSFVTLVRRNAS